VESGTMLHLDTVADQAGETLFTLQYTNGTVYSNLVSVVTDRFGRSARIFYAEDEDGLSLLSRIEDAAGLASAISYDTNGWPQTLATPYGSTTFEYDATNSFNTFHRRVRITEPNGGSQTYLFSSFCANLWSGAPWMSFELPASLVPGSLPEGTTIDTYMQPVNSFYWNQAQNSGVPTDLSQLTTNHLNKARLRHWLMRNPCGDWYPPDFALSWEAAPSQSEDGSTLGQITFYDYAGKDPNSPWLKGTQIQPSLMARKLPDGSTWYTAYERNSYGLAAAETSTYGTGNPASTRTHTYSYASNGQDLVERRGPGNVLLATYGYNARHQMTNEVLWPDSVTGHTNTWSYDEQGRLQSKTTAAGQTTTFSYNGSSGAYSGYLSSTSEEPVERSESFTWLNGMVRAHTDARGLTVTNFWDGLNRLTGRRYPDGTATTNLYSRATAYPNGTGGLGILDVTAAKDRLGRWTSFDYDPLRRITAKTNANGVVTRYGYCDCGSSASYITNAWGTPAQQVTIFTFDNQGNRTTESYADGYSVTNWFNALGQTIVSGDGTGYRWLFYNNQGLRTTVSNVFGAESVVTFDIHDRPEYATDANGVTVANAYDNLGRLLARGYPDDGVEWFGYSARGLVAYTNQLGLVTRYAYDEAGRKTYETNANTEVLRYTNSAAGDLLSLTDGKNQTTRWSYDEYGRVTNKLDQAGAEILRYRYDAESRLTNRWSAAKGNTGYAYDPVGNLTNVNYPSSADVRLQYDLLNRVTNMVDAMGTTKYAYTAGNQVWTEDGPFASDTVTNAYVNRLRVALGLGQPTGVWTNGFGYDAARRLTNVTSQAGAFGYGYTALYAGFSGQLVQQLGLPGGAYITNFYDPVARVLGTLLKSSGGSTLDAALYGYNAGNQRTAWTNASGALVQYSYDPIGQLKVANSSTNSEDRGYAYDAAWNLNWRTNAGTTTWAYYVDVKNQLTNGTMVGPASYDLNGNLTNRSRAAMSYEYDDENRLTAAQVLYQDDWGQWQGWRSEFRYDGWGRLRRRVEWTPDVGEGFGLGLEGLLGGGFWYPEYGVDYIYDGWRVIQERVAGGTTPLVSYTRGSDLSGSLEGAGGIGGLLARSSGYSGGNWTSHAYYHADGNGNITCLINASQSVVASYRYDPFGNTISKTGTLADGNVYRFSSKEVHVQSGMYYYGCRFYDPSLQRWITRDPFAEPGFETARRVLTPRLRGFLRSGEFYQHENLYEALQNDPIGRTDPTGLEILHYGPGATCSPPDWGLPSCKETCEIAGMTAALFCCIAAPGGCAGCVVAAEAATLACIELCK
jgi:RHS repeat-associated protein